MILSPVRKPALTAGDAGSDLAQLVAVMLVGTQGSMAPIVEELVLDRPIPTARMNSSTKASAKCMNDPAASTIIRCQGGCLRKERGSSSGSTSSRAVMPTILTKPPAGMALTPYSVSPRTRGPQGLAETHEELGDFHPELLRRGEVPRTRAA